MKKNATRQYLHVKFLIGSTWLNLYEYECFTIKKVPDI